MNFYIKRTFPDDPDFLYLVEFLNRELWNRNPGRQNEYVSLNLLNKEAKAMLLFKKDKPVACGAFRKLDKQIAEIKRMYVLPGYRGEGVSKHVLHELETWAKELGCISAILETGANHPEAISLYQKSGYKIIENYGPYKNMPESICMQKSFDIKN